MNKHVGGEYFFVNIIQKSKIGTQRERQPHKQRNSMTYPLLQPLTLHYPSSLPTILLTTDALSPHCFILLFPLPINAKFNAVGIGRKVKENREQRNIWRHFWRSGIMLLQSSGWRRMKGTDSCCSYKRFIVTQEDPLFCRVLVERFRYMTCCWKIVLYLGTYLNLEVERQWQWVDARWMQ